MPNGIDLERMFKAGSRWSFVALLLAMFGFFEAADAEVAHGLLSAVEAWARQRGRGHLRGPINPSLNDSCGLLIEGFDTDPMLLMPHNPPEYATHVEAAGYRKVKDLYAWICDIDIPLPPIIASIRISR